MNTDQLLTIKTRPGDVIVILRWENGKLKHFQTVKHDDNLGAIALPVGAYGYWVLGEVGSHAVTE